MTTAQLHQGQPVFHAGTPLEEAEIAVILLHRRGGSPQSILSLVPFEGDKIAFLIPAAHATTWYPQRFIAPREANQPKLDSALATVRNLLDEVAAAGIPAEKTVMMGFSQGACLALESGARHPQRYGALIALSGGLIGAAGEMDDYSGSLDGTPVFIGCSDVDFHVPLERVQESTQILTAMGASVDERIYPGMGHTVNQDEVKAVNALIASLR